MAYKKPFYCAICKRNRWPGDCPHRPMIGPELPASGTIVAAGAAPAVPDSRTPNPASQRGGGVVIAWRYPERIPIQGEIVVARDLHQWKIEDSSSITIRLKELVPCGRERIADINLFRMEFEPLGGLGGRVGNGVMARACWQRLCLEVGEGASGWKCGKHETTDQDGHAVEKATPIPTAYVGSRAETFAIDTVCTCSHRRSAHTIVQATCSACGCDGFVVASSETALVHYTTPENLPVYPVPRAMAEGGAVRLALEAQLAALPKPGTIYRDKLDADNPKRWKVSSLYVDTDGKGIVRVFMMPGGHGHVTIPEWQSFLATHEVTPERGCIEPACCSSVQGAPDVYERMHPGEQWCCPIHRRSLRTREGLVIRANQIYGKFAVPKKIQTASLYGRFGLRMPKLGDVYESRQEAPPFQPIVTRLGRRFKVDAVHDEDHGADRRVLLLNYDDGRLSLSSIIVGEKDWARILEAYVLRDERACGVIGCPGAADGSDLFGYGHTHAFLSDKELARMVAPAGIVKGPASEMIPDEELMKMVRSSRFPPLVPCHESMKLCIAAFLGEPGIVERGHAFETFVALCKSLSPEQIVLLDKICHERNNATLPGLRRRWPLGFTAMVPAGAMQNIPRRSQLPMTIRRLACSPGLGHTFKIVDIKVGRNSLFVAHEPVSPDVFPPDRPMKNPLVTRDDPDWENLPAEFVGPATDIVISVQNIGPCAAVFDASIWGDVGPLDPSDRPVAPENLLGAQEEDEEEDEDEDDEGRPDDTMGLDEDPRTTEEIMEPIDLFERMLDGATAPRRASTVVASLAEVEEASERTCPHGCKEKRDNHPAGCEPGCYYCSSRKMRPDAGKE